MLLLLLLLFTLLPVIELALLLWLKSLTNWGFAIALILLTGIVGAWLARQQGWRAWARVNESFAAGRLPGEELLDALLILVAGVLLVTPGMLTDISGFLLLIPGSRRVVARWLLSYFKRKLFEHTGVHTDRNHAGAKSAPEDKIIDVEAEARSEPEDRD